MDDESTEEFAYCWKCGAKIAKDALYCPKCGESQKSSTGSNRQQYAEQKEDDPTVSSKSRLIAFLLAFFLGGIGAHRFYVGKVGSGVAMILVNWLTLGIWGLVDLILICCGTFTDSDGKLIKNWDVSNN